MNKAINSYDYLRVLTIFTVVLVHTATPILNKYSAIPTNDWMAGNFYDSMIRWCVPVFFMLSGAFLLDPHKNDSLSNFFKKRMNKVLIPLLCWSIIYYFFSIKYDGSQLSIELFIRKLLNNDIYFHLWFLYILIGLYIITPIIKVFIKHTNKQLLIYFLIVWFIGNSVFDLFNFLFKLKIYFEIPLDDYLGYFVLGYFLRTHQIEKKLTIIIYILAIVSLFITFFGTFYETDKAGYFVSFYYLYMSPNTVIISMAVFLFFKNMNVSKIRFSIDKVIGFINNRSFGIYLIHIIALRVLFKHYQISAFSFDPLLSIPFVALLAFTLSCLAVYVLQKIPIVRSICP